VLLHRVEPAYPEISRRAHIKGFVILRSVIGLTRQVEDVQVVKSVHPLLDAAAIDAVRRWRYEPARLNGRALRVYLWVTVDFRLR
jgi:periplasmic protein TonB